MEQTNTDTQDRSSRATSIAFDVISEDVERCSIELLNPISTTPLLPRRRGLWCRYCGVWRSRFYVSRSHRESLRDGHRDENLKIGFADGESYMATYLATYESENTGELDIDENDPWYDQFYVVSFVITKIPQDSTRRYSDSISTHYLPRGRQDLNRDRR